MDHIGAGFAALGVVGPGIGIGILTGLPRRRSVAIPRRPRHPGRRSSSAQHSPKASGSSPSSWASCIVFTESRRRDTGSEVVTLDRRSGRRTRLAA